MGGFRVYMMRAEGFSFSSRGLGLRPFGARPTKELTSHAELAQKQVTSKRGFRVWGSCHENPCGLLQEDRDLCRGLFWVLHGGFPKLGVPFWGSPL